MEPQTNIFWGTFMRIIIILTIVYFFLILIQLKTDPIAHNSCKVYDAYHFPTTAYVQCYQSTDLSVASR